ncbi:UNVERIFIED_CONTAM: hypothetical protein PYX00_006566 [Menopon gallinae]|uniref:RCC1-like domain-containing protein n=1 Tax=Menopon gallinae TaxID=328185 RepID=A0AAW2HXB6_9NEOP
MRIYSWGSNSHGQLGQGLEIEQSTEPLPVTFDTEVKDIVGGGKHTVLISKSGFLFSCGDNDKGQLSKDLSVKSLLIFEPILLKVKISKVSCGWDFNLALSEDQDVIGWGGNSFGQLGLPQVSYIYQPTVIFQGKAVDVGAGLRHSVIVDTEGCVSASGFGKKGQLGVSFSGEKRNLYEFMKVSSIKNAYKVACGESHTVVSTKGALYAWGDNKFGQLGVDPKSKPNSNVPIPVELKINHTDIAALVSGWSHSAILTGSGKVVSWGRNDYGQLGEGRTESWRPKTVEALIDVRQLILGSNHGVVLRHNGEVLCWGWNEHGNCGNGSCENVYEPTLLNTKDFDIQLIGTGSAHSFFCVN